MPRKKAIAEQYEQPGLGRPVPDEIPVEPAKCQVRYIGPLPMVVCGPLSFPRLVPVEVEPAMAERLTRSGKFEAV